MRQHCPGDLIETGGTEAGAATAAAQQSSAGLPQRPDRQRLLTEVLQNRNNRLILERLPGLGLPDAWLVAGCLFQTIWNLASQRAPQADIRDYDLFYFDASDLSADAEQDLAGRVQSCFADLGVTVEAKNQARVHTWYPSWFGHAYAPLTSSRDGIDHFLVRCTCVGVGHGPDGLE